MLFLNSFNNPTSEVIFQFSCCITNGTEITLNFLLISLLYNGIGTKTASSLSYAETGVSV